MCLGLGYRAAHHLCSLLLSFLCSCIQPAGDCPFLNMLISVHVLGLWQPPTWMKPAAALMLCLQLSLPRRNMTQKLTFPQRRCVTHKWFSDLFFTNLPCSNSVVLSLLQFTKSSFCVDVLSLLRSARSALWISQGASEPTPLVPKEPG